MQVSTATATRTPAVAVRLVPGARGILLGCKRVFEHICQNGSKDNSVAYIITEPCVGTKDTACVDVCPVDCIHPRKDEPEFQSADMLYIHPDECIDCGACVPACPVEAIFALDETPEKWKHFIPVNAQFYQK